MPSIELLDLSRLPRAPRPAASRSRASGLNRAPSSSALDRPLELIGSASRGHHRHARQDPDGRRRLSAPSRRCAITNGRIVATGTSAEIARYAGQQHEDHRRCRRDGRPRPHRQSLPLHARCPDLAPTGPVRRCRLAARSAAHSRGQGREPRSPATGSWSRAAGRRASSPTRPGRLHASKSSTAWRRRIRCSCRRATPSVYANSLALKAVGLNPADGAQAARRRTRVLPAALCALRRHAQDPRPRSASRTSPTSCASSIRPGLTGALQPRPVAMSRPRAPPRDRCPSVSGKR